MNKTSLLTEKDHTNLTAALEHILDDYKNGTITKAQAVGTIAHGFTAMAEGEEAEVRAFLEEGRKLAREN